MTEEERARLEEYARGFGEQNEEGVDLSLLRENLRLTPAERLAKHQRALRLTLEVRRAGERAGLRRPTPEP